MVRTDAVILGSQISVDDILRSPVCNLFRPGTIMPSASVRLLARPGSPTARRHFSKPVRYDPTRPLSAACSRSISSSSSLSSPKPSIPSTSSLLGRSPPLRLAHLTPRLRYERPSRPITGAARAAHFSTSTIRRAEGGEANGVAMK